MLLRRAFSACLMPIQVSAALPRPSNYHGDLGAEHIIGATLCSRVARGISFTQYGIGESLYRRVPRACRCRERFDNR